MKKLNDQKIAVTYRNIKDFHLEDDSFIISIYSPTIGIIIDWSCNGNMLLKVGNIYAYNLFYIRK